MERAKKRKYWYVKTCIPVGWYFGLWKFAFPWTFLLSWFSVVNLYPMQRKCYFLIISSNSWIHLFSNSKILRLEVMSDPYKIMCDFVKYPWKCLCPCALKPPHFGRDTHSHHSCALRTMTSSHSDRRLRYALVSEWKEWLKSYFLPTPSL